jgi:hypothetical protein
VSALALMPLAAPALAQSPPPDSLAKHASTPALAGPPAPAEGDSTAAPRKLPWSEQPRTVMLRSLLVPGWGQWHNHSYVKSVAVAGVEGGLVSKIFSDRRRMDELLVEVNAARAAGDEPRYESAVAGYNDHLASYVNGQWLVAGVLAYALIDAYVDAHFRTFDIDFRTDPALPPGESPNPAPQGGSHAGGTSRLLLRWHF